MQQLSRRDGGRHGFGTDSLLDNIGGGGWRDYLINGDFSINQRDSSGGGLSDGTFGFDRWNSVGATNFTLSNGVVILASGKVRQVTEAPKLAGETVVVSLKNPSGTVAVALGSASGSGTQSYSLPISPPVA